MCIPIAAAAMAQEWGSTVKINRKSPNRSASSNKEVIRTLELGLDQALDDGENKRGREAEH
jgi:hypothetical protein